MTLTADDRLDITALYARQVWALDTGDVDGYVDTFTDDAVLDLAERHSGKAAIRQFAELFRLHDVGVPGSQHLVSSLLLDGDGGRCSVRAYVTRTHRLPGRGRNNCQIIWSGYFPAGLSYDRIFSELPDVPFRDHVWPKFLHENAARVFKLGG